MKGGKEAADAARVEKAAELGLPVKAGKVEYPDAQLEYDLDGRSGRVNVEIATEHYSTKSIGAKAAAGFAVHGSWWPGEVARVARALGRDNGNEAAEAVEQQGPRSGINRTLRRAHAALETQRGIDGHHLRREACCSPARDFHGSDPTSGWSSPISGFRFPGTQGWPLPR